MAHVGSAVYAYGKNSLEFSEKAKHSTTAVEHVCKIARDTFQLVYGDYLPAAYRVVDGHLGGVCKLIDGMQLIFPIDHFFISQNYLQANIYENVFYACHFVVSCFDMHDLLTDSKVASLAEYAAQVGRENPILRPAISFISGNFVSYTLLVMFTVHAKNAWDKINDPDTHVNEKAKARYTFLYSLGTIAGVGLGLTALASTPIVTGIHLGTQTIGLLGWKTGAYTP